MDNEPRVPVFRSEAEEIEFWDTHDPQDYLTGEEEPLEEILSPTADEMGGDLVVTLGLWGGPEVTDWGPVALHFAAAIRPDEDDRDLSIVFERDVIPRSFDGYSIEYRRATEHRGASAGPTRELRIDLFVNSRREAERIGKLLGSSMADHHEAGGVGLSRRAQDIVPRIAAWLREHNAREIPAEQAARSSPPPAPRSPGT